eukprot:1683686-Pyramimonas_sp.AAC.1
MGGFKFSTPSTPGTSAGSMRPRGRPSRKGLGTPSKAKHSSERCEIATARDGGMGNASWIIAKDRMWKQT